tara:strand:- start:281 stop:529 length:249 start_codon:yes stop_codon:yes gene_type:complete
MSPSLSESPPLLVLLTAFRLSTIILPVGVAICNASCGLVVLMPTCAESGVRIKRNIKKNLPMAPFFGALDRKNQSRNEGKNI